VLPAPRVPPWLGGGRRRHTPLPIATTLEFHLSPSMPMALVVPDGDGTPSFFLPSFKHSGGGGGFGLRPPRLWQQPSLSSVSATPVADPTSSLAFPTVLAPSDDRVSSDERFYLSFHKISSQICSGLTVLWCFRSHLAGSTVECHGYYVFRLFPA
jgi:hypothetical protein